jgi:hypothetical protein
MRAEAPSHHYGVPRNHPCTAPARQTAHTTTPKAHARSWLPNRPAQDWPAFICFYVTLRQQDYALLMGAVALFLVLAIVMYVTRRVDWYARDAG